MPPQSLPADGAWLDAHVAELRRAAERIRPHVRRTPLLPTAEPGLYVKPECLQVTGAFKARGGFNAILALLERDPSVPGVVTHSSGNHGQAVAGAAQAAGISATVVMPATVTPAKIDGVRAYGARAVVDGVTFDNREEIAESIAAAEGLYLVHPYDDWDIIHGAGSVGLEILEDLPSTATIVVPIGGGGQISGIALAVAALSPGKRVIGVEPASADDAARSLRTGVLQTLAADPATMAEGVKCRSIGARNFEVMVEHRLVDDVVTVSEAEIADALRYAWARLKLAIEATAALPLAAWLTGRVPAGDALHPTVAIISGGNFDRRQVAAIVGEPEPSQA